MTDRELFEKALEALEEISGGYSQNLIAALRERLAQPEQDWDWRHPKAQALIGAKARLQIKLRLVEQLLEDPNLETTASDMEYWEPLHDKLQERLAQPEQEPVAWTGVDFAIDCTPQRRELVGLTDEEVKALPQWFPSHETAAVLPLIRAIEAKLREKNT